MKKLFLTLIFIIAVIAMSAQTQPSVPQEGVAHAKWTGGTTDRFDVQMRIGDIFYNSDSAKYYYLECNFYAHQTPANVYANTSCYQEVSSGFFPPTAEEIGKAVNDSTEPYTSYNYFFSAVDLSGVTSGDTVSNPVYVGGKYFSIDGNWTYNGGSGMFRVQVKNKGALSKWYNIDEGNLKDTLNRTDSLMWSFGIWYRSAWDSLRVKVDSCNTVFTIGANIINN